MSKQRGAFSAELKREAAALVLDQAYSHVEACRSLGVVDSALRRRVKQIQQERDGITPAEQSAHSRRAAETPRARSYLWEGGFGFKSTMVLVKGGCSPRCSSVGSCKFVIESS